MRKILIFGGTTEGRELAVFCAEKGISAYISVVSGYGRNLLPESPFLSPLEGAMEQADMEKFFREKGIRLVVDATHPYAVNVSANIRRAAAAAGGVRVVRCLRPETAALLGAPAGPGIPAGPGTSGSPETPALPGVIFAESAAAAAEILRADVRAKTARGEEPDPVLLTVGSHELGVFTAVPELRGLLFARILPGGKPLALAEKAGIEDKRIIAMQGPFSREMNRAVLSMTHAGWMVMKDSGEAGGTPEKLAAASDLGIRSLVIRRPREAGITVPETERLLLREAGRAAGWPQDEQCASTGSSDAPSGAPGVPAHIFLCGIGPGNPDLMTEEVRRAVRESDLLIGAARMLRTAEKYLRGCCLPEETLPRMAEACLPDAVLELLRHAAGKTVSVLYSGDTGFHSGASGLRRRLREGALPGACTVRVLPGISSVSCLASVLGISLEDAEIFSAHGQRVPEEELRTSLERPEKPWKIFLLGGKDSAGPLLRCLLSLGCGEDEAYLAEKLSYPEERVTGGIARELLGAPQESPAILALRHRTAEPSGISQEYGDAGRKTT